jgi:hypothetical protein
MSQLQFNDLLVKESLTCQGEANFHDLVRIDHNLSANRMATEVLGTQHLNTNTATILSLTTTNLTVDGDAQMTGNLTVDNQILSNSCEITQDISCRNANLSGDLAGENANIRDTLTCQQLYVDGIKISNTGGGGSGSGNLTREEIKVSVTTNLTFTGELHQLGSTWVTGTLGFTGSGSNDSKILATFDPQQAPRYDVYVPVFELSAYSCVDLLHIPRRNSAQAGEIRCNRWNATRFLMIYAFNTLPPVHVSWCN